MPEQPHNENHTPPTIYYHPDELEEHFRRVAKKAASEALHELGLEEPQFRDALKKVVSVAGTLEEVAKGWQALGWLRKAFLWFSTLTAAGLLLWSVLGESAQKIKHFFTIH